MDPRWIAGGVEMRNRRTRMCYELYTLFLLHSPFFRFLGSSFVKILRAHNLRTGLDKIVNSGNNRDEIIRLPVFSIRHAVFFNKYNCYSTSPPRTSSAYCLPCWHAFKVCPFPAFVLSILFKYFVKTQSCQHLAAKQFTCSCCKFCSYTG